MRILQASDSALDLDWHDAGTVGRADLRVGFERAVQAAIDHRADVFLHAGGLVNGSGDAADHVSQAWLEGCLARLDAAGVQPIVHETGFELYGLSAVSVPWGGVIEHGRLVVASGLAAAAEGELVIRCVWGRVRGISTARGSAQLDEIDASELLAADADWIAMAGTRRTRLVQHNACYAGATARLDRYCTGSCNALLVELGDDTGRILSLEAIRLPGRKVYRLDIDASGMGAGHLGSIIHQRIEETIDQHAAWRRSVIGRLASHGESPTIVRRINAAYGREAAPDKLTSWVPRRPLVVIAVVNALATHDEVWAAEPRLAWPLEQGAVCRIITDFDGRRRMLDPPG